MVDVVTDSRAAVASLIALPVADLKGVGAKTEERLQSLGVANLLDVLLHLPLRYEDRTRVAVIAELCDQESVTVVARVVSARVVFGKRRQLLCQIEDDTGVMNLRFFHFNQAQQRNLSEVGARIRCFGVVRANRSGGWEMMHPTYQLGELADKDPSTQEQTHYTPIYPTVKGMSQRVWLQISAQALAILEKNSGWCLDGIPLAIRCAQRLPTIREALLFAHRPPLATALTAIQNRAHPCFKRLALQEMLAHQLAYEQSHDTKTGERAPCMRLDAQLACTYQQQLTANLEFELTAAQQRVLREIAADLAQNQPMHRLLQGDVGSGKTLVAALAVCQSVGNGYQAAVMAPTEILALQHERVFKKLLEPLGITVSCLVGSLVQSARVPILQSLADGSAQVVVGTHALFQDTVSFAQLGLVVVDEQHRFGVSQRLALRGKGQVAMMAPHQLVMTATPIPRTLAMAAYAHCTHSVIDELPPGRKPIQTAMVSASRRGEVIERMALQLDQGAQAYWVCPLIAESDSLQAQAAESSFAQLQQALPEHKVGLLHGRMSAQDKDTVMRAFVDGQLQVLVATTVIEVGVDVPRACVMVIENAERFGLAQLHQLRGRVGRGADASHCILIYSPALSEVGRSRLQVLREHHDGFKIAQADLAQRGPGEVLGVKQAGFWSYQVADWQRDADLLPVVQEIKEQLSGQDWECMHYFTSFWFKKDQQWLNG